MDNKDINISQHMIEHCERVERYLAKYVRMSVDEVKAIIDSQLATV